MDKVNTAQRSVMVNQSQAINHGYGKVGKNILGVMGVAKFFFGIGQTVKTIKKHTVHGHAHINIVGNSMLPFRKKV